MGIKFLCPNGHKLHVKSFLASQRGVCPQCGEKFLVPAQSLPDIRVESLGVKESKRLAAAAGTPSINSPGDHLPRDEFAAQEDFAATTGVQTAPADLGPARPSGGRGSDLAPVSPAFTAAESDPIAAAPAALWYVRIANGEQFGPAQGDLMQRWLTEGRVAADSLVWREGWAEWVVAGNIFRQLSRDFVPTADVPGSIDAFEKGLAEQVESLILPSQQAGEAAPAGDAANEARAKTSAVLDSRKQAKSRHRIALTVLALAIVCLLPLLIIVLMKQ